MKWPAELVLIRHVISAYNELRARKAASPLYQRFKAAYSENPDCKKTRDLAQVVWREFALNVGDWNTPIAQDAERQAEIVGAYLRQHMQLPDIVYRSPFLRVQHTYNGLVRGWPELGNVECKDEERIREQEHGLALIYNDWRVFFALHPEQRMLYELEGPYWYRYPQGENVPDMRARNHEWLDALIRDYAEKRVLALTHHLNILAVRTNLERLDAEAFLRLDREEKPINCGVTVYSGDPKRGKNGKMVLSTYNARHY